MKQYFLKITGTYAPKNRPQETLLKQFRKYENTLIIGLDGLDILNRSIVEDLDAINGKHLRCKDLMLDCRYSHDDESCYAVHSANHTILTFHLYPVQNTISN